MLATYHLKRVEKDINTQLKKFDKPRADSIAIFSLLGQFKTEPSRSPAKIHHIVLNPL